VSVAAVMITITTKEKERIITNKNEKR